MKKFYASKLILNQLNWSKFSGILIFAFVLSLSLNSQTPAEKKKEAEIKKLEAQLKTADLNYNKAERAKAINDSLMDTGMTMQDEGDQEFNQLEADQKKLDKEYAAQTKALNKRMVSKDKEDAAQAKKEFKEADLKYKAEQKEYANKKKILEKKVTTGKMNSDKAKASRKMNEEAHARAKANKESIEQKLEALKSGDTEAEAPAKKGKKK